MKFFLFLFLFLIIVLPLASAVGIGGDLSVDLDFKPGLVYQQEYSVGDSNPDGLIIVAVSGPLQSFFDVNPTEIIGEGRVKVSLKLPENLEGGLYQTKICAQSMPQGSGAFISVASACGVINIRSLFDGKYLQTWSFSAGSVDLVDENIPFYVTLDNWGKEDIVSAYASINIYDNNNNLVGTTKTENKGVPSAQEVTLNSYLKNTLEPGSYWAEAELFWDEGTDKKNTTFNVGSALVKVENITTDFYVNETNLVNISIKNGFKGITENVYLTLEVGEKLIKSPTLTLNPFEVQNIELALDTRGFELRDYKARVIIYKDNEESNRQEFTFTMKERERPLNMGLVIGLVIVLAVILGNIVFVVFMVKRRRPSKPEQTVLEEAR